MSFNHNDHYHPLLIRCVPPHCRKALDVGCGTGAFARLLAERAEMVDAVDRSEEMIRVARSLGEHNITYSCDDMRSFPLAPNSYDFISCIASIHHLPFADTVSRLRDALAPGGVLAILGLSKPTLTDYAVAAVAAPANWAHGIHARLDKAAESTQPPIRDPEMTLKEIRREAEALLPGARIRRHLYWRYSLVYKKTA